jgi:hypothetical protein
MPQREFANQKALVAYAEQNDIAYEYEYTPDVSRVMLFSMAIIQAEWEANAPLREAMAIKRERLL